MLRESTFAVPSVALHILRRLHVLKPEARFDVLELSGCRQQHRWRHTQLDSPIHAPRSLPRA